MLLNRSGNQQRASTIPKSPKTTKMQSHRGFTGLYCKIQSTLQDNNSHSLTQCKKMQKKKIWRKRCYSVILLQIAAEYNTTACVQFPVTQMLAKSSNSESSQSAIHHRGSGMWRIQKTSPPQVGQECIEPELSLCTVTNTTIAPCLLLSQQLIAFPLIILPLSVATPDGQYCWLLLKHRLCFNDFYAPFKIVLFLFCLVAAIQWYRVVSSLKY